MNKTSVICVTGPMASGKNYICSQYEKQGWISLDADKTVHQAIETVSSEILAAFGKIAQEKDISIQNPDGSLNRRALGKLLFSDPELLHKQEQIVYPIVIRETKAFINENPGKKIILNATLLFKTPELLELCEKIVFVKAPLVKRIIRARKRDHLPYKQIFKRFKTQKNLLSEYKKSGKPVIIVKN